MTSRRSWVAVAALAATVLAGCADDDPPPDYRPLPSGRSTQDAETRAENRMRREAGVRLMEGDGYWYVAPEGWRDATRRFRKIQKQLDTAAQAGVPAPGEHEDSVGIWTTPVVGRLDVELPRLAALFAKQLGTYALGVERVKGRHRIDRHPAAKLVGQARFGARPAVIEQYVTVAHRHIYVITFSLAADRTDEQQDAVVDQILGTWHWV